MSKTDAPTTTLTLAEKAHRPVDVIEAELDAARARFNELEPKARDYHTRRQRAIARVERLKAAWASDNPGEPFDPESYAPPAVVPPPGSDLTRQFHRQHYTVGALESELEAAKQASVGR